MRTSKDVSDDNKIEFQLSHQRVRISAWGNNALRVQCTISHSFDNPESALSEHVPHAHVETVEDADKKTYKITNGDIVGEVRPNGKLVFIKKSTGAVVLEEFARDLTDPKEPMNSALQISSREFKRKLGADSSHVTVRFESLDPNEKIYGMGQYQQPNLDLKGSDLELAQRNSQASIPFAISSLGYGILWNNAGVGRAVFGKNQMSFEAYSSKTIDYWVVVGDSPRDIHRAYTAVTGRPPMMPEYGLGLWQSKLRYQTQEELLGVVHEYKRRKLPLDVIVIDFFHWPKQGEWKFDTTYWPDPDAMIEEIQSMGTKVVVSVWPTVETQAENYPHMAREGMLAQQDRSLPVGMEFPTTHLIEFMDTFNPATRDFVWNICKKNYWDKGIRSFWLDVAEPEYKTYSFDNHRYHTGPNLMVGNAYPKHYSRMFHEGMSHELGDKAGDNIVNLVRCAWTGSVKYGALLWSGDVNSSWQSMKCQFAAGLNAGLAGQTWWTVDIGGFHGANINDTAFHELFVRWYQWGTFLPVMRVHGNREPTQPRHGTTGGSDCPSGAPNEIWTYGEEVYEICKTYLALRESMRSYVRDLMKQAHEKGDPIIRTLFFEFPSDKHAWSVEDQFMFGHKYLVAPIFEPGVKQRTLYLPSGANWHQVSAEGKQGDSFEGGKEVTVDCPLDCMPVFVREG
ncbi:putative glycosyl hydrolase [Kockovaella imperatae]|uniref:Putative glycosyl hydrolase n=1 Tax=Kockovaella imperatae TaxID=4999 RepID=A0A1Y1UEZ6_9TREE|nr:putative glycosyl hydrolase [Kockovaella imperatae]ORX36592.1 putative glycosyl hydrolase [Kockovaella imperatae]